MCRFGSTRLSVIRLFHQPLQHFKPQQIHPKILFCQQKKSGKIKCFFPIFLKPPTLWYFLLEILRVLSPRLSATTLKAATLRATKHNVFWAALATTAKDFQVSFAQKTATLQKTDKDSTIEKRGHSHDYVVWRYTIDCDLSAWPCSCKSYY